MTVANFPRKIQYSDMATLQFTCDRVYNILFSEIIHDGDLNHITNIRSDTIFFYSFEQMLLNLVIFK